MVEHGIGDLLDKSIDEMEKNRELPVDEAFELIEKLIVERRREDKKNDTK